jgi:hypothetical protein
MPSLREILSRTFFWSYERGTWQYDIAVAVILIFALLTPRHWFHDQPASGVPAAPGQVLLLSQDGNRQTYRVDTRVLAPPTKLALQPDLHKGNFSILKIEPERDEQGTAVAYHVEIRR